MNIEIKKKLARNWFILLRNIILYEIESLEKEYSLKKKIMQEINSRAGESLLNGIVFKAVA